MELYQKTLALYTALSSIAVAFTNEYLKAKMEGENGKDWGISSGFFQRKFPYVASVLLVEEENKTVVAVGCGWNTYFMKMVEDYTIENTKDGLIVWKRGYGFDPGGYYLIGADGTVNRAGYTHHDSCPTVGSDGKLAWSSPRTWLNFENIVPCNNSDIDALTEILGKIEKYNKPIA